MGVYSTYTHRTERFQSLSILNYYDSDKGKDSYYVLLRKVKGVKTNNGWEPGWMYVEAEKIGTNSFSWDDEDEDCYVRGNSFFDDRWRQVR